MPGQIQYILQRRENQQSFSAPHGVRTRATRVTVHVKGIVRPFEFGGRDSVYYNWRPGKFFYNFNGTISREEHETITGLMITGLALSQSELLAFFSLWQVNIKISHRILFNPTIPEDDLLRLA